MEVDVDRVFVALNIFGVFRTITLDILNIFDGIEHTVGLFKKKLSFIVYGKMFFLIDLFLSSRRL